MPSIASTTPRRPAALASVVFDLDDLELEELDLADAEPLDDPGGHDVEDGELELVDATLIESADETVILHESEVMDLGSVGMSRYPDALCDAEIDMLVGSMTSELCRTAAVRRTTTRFDHSRRR